VLRIAVAENLFSAAAATVTHPFGVFDRKIALGACGLMATGGGGWRYAVITLRR
jgi:hypothetical protein